MYIFKSIHYKFNDSVFCSFESVDDSASCNIDNELYYSFDYSVLCSFDYAEF